MLTFALAAFVLIMIPGPDQALITRNALMGGRGAGLFTMAGGMLGLSVHISAASLGVSALLLASATAFTVLKVVGTVYLVWMGVMTLRSARRAGPREKRPAAASLSAPRLPARRCVRDGFLSNALNPKVALFFVTFLPQFLPTQGATLGRALALSVVFVLLYLLWFSLYVLTVDHFGAFLRRPSVRTRIEQATGGLLIAFGIRLAILH